MSGNFVSSALALLLLVGANAVGADSAEFPTGYTDTPLIPGSRWRVHDDTRPRPPVVTPGTAGAPPSDAVVLFDGRSLSSWSTDKGEPAKWKVENGYVEVVPGSGDLVTRQPFGDGQLHIEFRTPSPPVRSSQGRSNSGVFLYGLYEVQVLDSYENVTYADGQASAIYGQSPPLVNASRPPGEWQTYDIVFTGPRFRNGEVETPGYVTVFHNGVITQHQTKILGASAHRATPPVVVHAAEGPIKLQDHGDPIRFRNIWIRPLRPAQ
jgi:hypothetical protein